MGIFPQIGMKIENVSNHHLEILELHFFPSSRGTSVRKVTS